MIDVMLIYEHKVREIETIIAIDNELRRRGLSTCIMCITDLNKLKYSLMNPKLVVVPSLYSTQSLKDQVGFIFGNAKKVLNLQWEQVYNGDFEVSTRTPKDIAKQATHVCWGEESYQRLTKAGIKNAFLIGPPQMDFLKKEYEYYYLSRENILIKYNIENNSKILLFISSFAYHCVTEKQLEKINNLVDWDAYLFKKITIDTRSIVFNWFEKMLTNYPNYVLVYRPHPSELDDHDLLQMENKYPNFRIIRDYSVKQWIKVSDVVLNWFSTSGVESFFAKKDCLYLRPIELNKDYDYKMYRNVLKIKDYDKFEYYVNNPQEIDEYYLKHNIASDINEYYLLDEDVCFKKICDLIGKMLECDDYNISSKYVTRKEIISAHERYFVKYILDNLYSFFPKLISKTLCKNKTIYEYLREHEYRKNESITLNEINEIIDRINICVKKN